MKNLKKLAQLLKKYSKNKEKIYFILEISFFILIAFAGIYFRFFKIKELMLFNSDLGTELAVIQEIQRTNTLPLVGPEVGIINLNTPPTYFLILSLFSILFKTENIVFLYGIMNIMAVFMVFASIWIFTDKKTAFILFPLIMLNGTFIFQSRQIWHPHPVAFFFSVALLFSFLAQKYKNVLFIFLSVVFYFISTSIYISPTIFLPYFLYITFKFYRGKYTKTISFLTTLSTFFLVFVPIYTSQIIFEFSKQLPSLKALSGSKQIGFSSWSEFLTIFEKNISLFFREMLLKNEPIPFAVTAILLSYVILVYIKKLKQKKEILGSFLIAFCIIFFFNPEMYAEHRFHELFIFAFFIIAQAFFLIKKALIKREIIAITLFIIFMTYNHLILIIRFIPSQEREYSKEPTHYFSEKIKISKKIKKIIEENKISNYFLLNTTDQEFGKKHVFSSKIDFLKRDLYMEQYFSFSYWTLLNQEEGKPIFSLDEERNQFKYHHLNEILQKENILYLCFVENSVENCFNPDLKKEYSFKEKYPLNSQIYLAHFRRNYIRY